MKKLNILIIDDSPSDRRLYRRYLSDQKKFEVEVKEASTGKQGLIDCQVAKPDAILLDFKLPDMTGISLIPELQKISKAPIIFITGQPEASTQTAAYQRGAVSFISKDFLGSESLMVALINAVETGE